MNKTAIKWYDITKPPFKIYGMRNDFYHNCTIDGCHPNDLGFYRMAQVLAPVLAEALNLPEPSPHDYLKF